MNVGTGVFIGAIVVMLIVYYIPYSISIYKMAKKYEIPAPGLAWIPGVSLWIFGSIADKIKLRGGKKANFAALLLGGWGVTTIISNLSSGILVTAMPEMAGVTVVTMLNLLGTGISIAMFVFIFIAYYNIYKDYSDSVVGLMVLSIFVPFAIPFIFFSMLKKQSRSEQFVNCNAPQGDNSFYNQ